MCDKLNTINEVIIMTDQDSIDLFSAKFCWFCEKKVSEEVEEKLKVLGI